MLPPGNIPNPNTANPSIQTLHQYEPIQYITAQQTISYCRQKGDSIEVFSEPFKNGSVGTQVPTLQARGWMIIIREPLQELKKTVS